MTLVDEISRRQSKAPDSGKWQLTGLSPKDEEELNTILDEGYWLVLPLTFIHFLLAILVRYQYGQDVTVGLALKDCWVSIPVLFFLFHTFHPHRHKLWAKLLLIGAGAFIGSYLVYISNEEGYYATMQKSPPLGTLGIWCFIEMPWTLAVPCLLTVGVYTYSMGYHL